MPRFKIRLLPHSRIPKECHPVKIAQFNLTVYSPGFPTYVCM